MTGRVAAVIACVFLSEACGLVHRDAVPDPGIHVPASWTAAEVTSSATPTDAWWTTLGDPTLDALIPEALANNRDLRAASARVHAAVAQASIAGADRLPALAISGVSSRQRRNFIGFPDFGGTEGSGGPSTNETVVSTTSNRFGASLDISWELDLWGRLAAHHQAARSEVAAAEAERMGARLSLAAQTAKAWFAAIEAREQLDLATETVASYAATAERVSDRYQRGVRPALDVRLARSQLAGARALVEQQRRRLDLAVRQLEILLGRYPAAVIDPAASLPVLSGGVPVGLPADLVSRRPDLAAARQRVAAANARVSESRAALLPRISLTGSSGSASEQLQELVNGDFSIWTLAANLTQPLFEGGRLRAGVELSRARQKEALASFVQSALQAYGEVESTLFAETTLASRERDLKLAAKESSEASRLAMRRYETGIDDYVSVLAAQRAELSDRGRHLAARRERLDNRIDLYLAIGGGFESHASSVAVSTTTNAGIENDTEHQNEENPS